MNSETFISGKTSSAVALGGFTLFCESFSAMRTRLFTEQNTSGGNIIFTNTDKKAMRLTLKGRVCGADAAADFLISADALICSGESFDITYGGMLFSGCRMLTFSAEDRGDDFIYAQVVLITDSQAVAADAEDGGEAV